MVVELSPEDVKDRIDEDATQVIDIRSPAQYAQGHIPGAINVPMREIPTRAADIDWADDVVCVCPIGQSSIQAAKLIRSFEGVDDDAQVASMKGGYRAWEYDLETGSQPEPHANTE